MCLVASWNKYPAPRRKNDDRAADQAWGNTVIVKGKARPPHAGAQATVVRRNPHGHVWREIATVPVSDAGTMRYRWLTTHDDARRDPYVFKFRIRGQR